jgi:CRISPR-associated protein Cmr2
MKPWPDENEKPLTLSVGLAIAHFMENLEDLLEYGRAAEKHAKTPKAADGPQADRDGLAVHVVKRGGGPVTVRANWTERPDDRLATLAGLLESGAIPGTVAYDLLRVADVYENWEDQGQLKAAIQADALRTIKAKQPREAGGLEGAKTSVEQVTDARSLRRLVDELLVARQIAVAARQAKGRNSAETVP